MSKKAKPPPPPETQEPVGIPCATCGCCHHYTLKTTPARQGMIRRRRECRNCGRTFTTTERVQGAG